MAIGLCSLRLLCVHELAYLQNPKHGCPQTPPVIQAHPQSCRSAVFTTSRRTCIFAPYLHPHAVFASSRRICILAPSFRPRAAFTSSRRLRTANVYNQLASRFTMDSIPPANPNGTLGQANIAQGPAQAVLFLQNAGPPVQPQAAQPQAAQPQAGRGGRRPRPNDPNVLINAFYEQFNGPQNPPLLTASQQVESCTGCGDQYPLNHLIKLDCNHYYCKGDCMDRMVRTSLYSLQFQPVRCCNEITVQQLTEMNLDNHYAAHYAIRLEEAQSQSADRLYCHHTMCRDYIPYGLRGKRAGTCIRCHRKTCKSCHQKSHFGACDRSALEADRQALEPVHQLAREEGWQVCPNCHVIVDKMDGCDEIICACGAHFCYTCGRLYGVDREHDEGGCPLSPLV
ncbi:hypothetical protein F4821DRAFT_255018 [Hypoxylon rubiginosum]|uniref:Uncharacterized protein n=1 Tax=Hypoxylon rubiginosum TaxID=110542 RepID=A0ACC0DEH0_9PEZI|nr:hypothetical protein F4821DRAFT_255018 [Hypoxylon rubiginosum]